MAYLNKKSGSVLLGYEKAFLMLALSLLPAFGNAQKQLSASERMTVLGPEGQALAKRAGTWDVTLTSWSKPGVAPETMSGLIAEREMIGPMLEEKLHPAPGTSGPAWTRVDDLLYSPIDGRWDYMSMDTRAPVGLMPAFSLGRDSSDHIFVSFIPFTVPGDGPNVSGQMLRMEQVIVHTDDDHDEKNQYFIPADGIAVKWLAKRYSYTRRK